MTPHQISDIGYRQLLFSQLVSVSACNLVRSLGPRPKVRKGPGALESRVYFCIESTSMSNSQSMSYANIYHTVYIHRSKETFHAFDLESSIGRNCLLHTLETLEIRNIRLFIDSILYQSATTLDHKNHLGFLACCGPNRDNSPVHKHVPRQGKLIPSPARLLIWDPVTPAGTTKARLCPCQSNISNGSTRSSRAKL